MKTDWFELRQARLHLAPYTYPHFPISVASVLTPSGVTAAGKHGLGVLSLGAGLPGGPEAIAEHWKIGEEMAAKHGKTLDRDNWRLVVNVHLAEDDELAMRQVYKSERHETVTYFEETLGRPPGRADDPLARRGEDGRDARRIARAGDQGHRAAGRADPAAVSAACSSGRTSGPRARRR